MDARGIIKRKLLTVMAGDANAPFVSLATVLSLFSLFYGAAQRLRRFAYRQRLLPSRQLPSTVICVGNMTMGGTGKTPMTIYLAQEIKQLGYKVAVVSRGYRGTAEGRGGIVSNGQTIRMGPEQAGDEPYMMACCLKDTPVIVGKNRYAAGMLAIQEFESDVILLDDGYQHLKLKRDIDLVLLDHAQPFGNSHLLPRGTLREPISALERATACILTRHRIAGAEAPQFLMDLIKQHSRPKPVFTTAHVPYCYLVKSGLPIPRDGALDRHLQEPEIEELQKDTVVGFSGIARNADFRRTINHLGFNVGCFLEFSDHHRYNTRDVQFIRSQVDIAGARRLITTEKDLMRLAPRNPFPLELVVVGVKISFGNQQQEFRSFLRKRLKE